MSVLPPRRISAASFSVSPTVSVAYASTVGEGRKRRRDAGNA
jgi:hypothetical protein